MHQRQVFLALHRRGVDARRGVDLGLPAPSKGDLVPGQAEEELHAVEQGLLQSEASQDAANEAIRFRLRAGANLTVGHISWRAKKSRVGGMTHLLLGLVDLPALARRTRPIVALAASTDLHPSERAIVAAERPRADVVSSVLIAVLFVDAGEVLERVRGGRGRDGAATGAGEGAELGRVLERIDSAAAGTVHCVAHRRPT